MWRVHLSLIEFCEESVCLSLNFVKSPFVLYSILWRIHFFSHWICEEEFVFLILNFVKCPKRDSVFLLNRHLRCEIEYAVWLLDKLYHKLGCFDESMWRKPRQNWYRDLPEGVKHLSKEICWRVIKMIKTNSNISWCSTKET